MYLLLSSMAYVGFLSRVARATPFFQLVSVSEILNSQHIWEAELRKDKENPKTQYIDLENHYHLEVCFRGIGVGKMVII
ncbi:Isopenicillin N epimerase component 2 [Bienertia sinuspersici]